MGRKQLSDIEKSRALTLLEGKMSVANVAAEMKAPRQAIYDLQKAAGPASRCSTEEEEGVWWPMKTSKRTDTILKRAVT